MMRDAVYLRWIQYMTAEQSGCLFILIPWYSVMDDVQSLIAIKNFFFLSLTENYSHSWCTVWSSSDNDYQWCEGWSVNGDSLTDFWSKLPRLLEGYASRNIFNVVETGLRYCAMPDKTLTVQGQQCNGGEGLKGRLTVSLCLSQMGDVTALIDSTGKLICIKDGNELENYDDSQPELTNFIQTVHFAMTLLSNLEEDRVQARAVDDKCQKVNQTAITLFFR